MCYVVRSVMEKRFYVNGKLEEQSKDKAATYPNEADNGCLEEIDSCDTHFVEVGVNAFQASLE